MEDPAPALVEAMDATIDAELVPLGIERETEEPEHIVFTHNH